MPITMVFFFDKLIRYVYAKKIKIAEVYIKLEKDEAIFPN